MKAVVNKKNLGFFLIGFGAAAGALVMLFSYANRGQGGGYLVMLLMAVGCIVAGSILSFTRVLDRFAEPVVSEIEAVVQDDIEDIRARRFTTVQLMVAVTAVLSIVFLFFILRYQKLAATWGGFPVAVPALILVGVVTWIVTRSAWFKNQNVKTTCRIFLIPVAGLILSMVLGIALTEPSLPVDGESAAGRAAGVNIAETEGIGFDSGFDLSLFDSFDCDDDACGALFLVIALFVLTLIMVVGSAFIPHFWFVAGSVLLTVLLLMTVHEIRLRPEGGKKQEAEPAV